MKLIRTDYSPTTHTPAVSGREMTSLFRHIRESLSTLDNMERADRAMIKELQAFLESYYTRVLPLTARLERLRYRKAHGVFPNRSVAMDLSAPEMELPKDALAAKRKALFRRLVKLCHPDNANTSTPVDIAEVYEAGTLGALWLLAIRCDLDSIAEDDSIVRCLETHRAEIGMLILQARARARQVRQTDQWELKERVFTAALEGVDLIQQIERRIENQIAALQQYFVKPKEFQAAS